MEIHISGKLKHSTFFGLIKDFQVAIIPLTAINIYMEKMRIKTIDQAAMPKK